MSVLTVARYRTITLDTTSGDAAVTAALADAETDVAEYLRRPLELAERTETLTISRDGRVYPSATPIVELLGDDTGLTREGNVIVGASPDAAAFVWIGTSTAPTATITYRGGWDAASLPKAVERAIAMGAYHAIHWDPALVPAGATSARVGDAAVSFGAGGASGDPLASQLAQIRRYRRRFV